MQIRIATSQDRDNIHNVNWSAFSENEREAVSKIAVNLLSEETTPKTFSWVAQTDGVAVGHVAFSPVSIADNKNFQGYILAPLAVKPDYQKQHIGSKLIKNGIQQLSKIGVDILFVYGDPKYYSRFGFSTDVAELYIPPYKLEYPFGWQGIALKDCYGTLTPSKISCVNSLSDPTLW